MSILTLIRHGQASFFAKDYDQLSALGEQQAQLLGDYWYRRGTRYDAIFTGPRVRQRRSAELAVAACRQQGGICPEPDVLDTLDEYDLHGLIHVLGPELCRQDAAFAHLVERYLGSEPDERLRSFQELFEPLLHHWQSPAGAAVKMETWPQFQSRVQSAILQLQARDGRGERIAAFTSGGFIGCAVHLALGAPDRAALELHWRLRNGSLTEFAFTRERFSLDSFNTLPYLEDPALWTYR